MGTLSSRLRAVALTTAGVVAAVVVVAAPAQATNIGTEGCTPGYWKNHTESWEEYAPSDLVRDQHWLDGRPALNATYGSWTLLQALDGGGGSGLDGATKILLRAATAAYLNAAHEGVGYPYRRFNDEGGTLVYPTPLKTSIQQAVNGGREPMLALAKILDNANNLGCPLN